ncbi:hypothetical protein BV25DRAFT_705637 [Artomyces pyxidatus]|uniref:Uncharacterized protein n=1 Tax=Artomyces pyxidatus TaxID=48021 RepID=A0ACB8T0W0_9AGAM|nr:hypothetical protein BV25DRAFT_705637 [Artomyces pyxidatus]
MALERLIFTSVAGNDVAGEQLKTCADLFTENHGVWGSEASRRVSPSLKQGARVKMSASKIREQCPFIPTDTALVTCHADDLLVGHVFATT